MLNTDPNCYPSRALQPILVNKSVNFVSELTSRPDNDTVPLSPNQIGEVILGPKFDILSELSPEKIGAVEVTSKSGVHVFQDSKIINSVLRSHKANQEDTPEKALKGCCYRCFQVIQVLAKKD